MGESEPVPGQGVAGGLIRRRSNLFSRLAVFPHRVGVGGDSEALPLQDLAMKSISAMTVALLALPIATAARVLENYELQKVGQDRVAGLDADVLMLKPRDRLRFPQRLWAHRETGLLLRNDVLAPGGEVLESSAFVDVRLGAKLQPDQN